MKVRTRLAPSPTGSPHVGTAYQALIDSAFAKKHKGQFVVRIEDTDKKREVPGAEGELFEALKWLGIVPDESPVVGGPYAPYRQSERLEIYKKHALDLVEKGAAYFCFCTKERLDKIRKEQESKKQPPRYDGLCRKLDLKASRKRFEKGEAGVIRLKVPESGETVVKDPIRGAIKFKNSEIDDQVLLKSDGRPTYHLAVVVDDHLMQITHPVRSEEWISSYPKHQLLYKAFGWEMPLYTHTPLIRGSKHEKLGKRFGHSSLNWFRAQGFLPEALLNYLALLGWSHPEGKEFFNLEEFISVFDLKDLSAVGPVFDLTKLTWLNNQWMQYLSDDVVYQHLLEHWQSLAATIPEETVIPDETVIPAKAGIHSPKENELVLKIIPLAKPRMQTLADFNALAMPLLEDEDSFEKRRLANLPKVKINNGQCEKVRQTLEALDAWSAENIKKTLLALYEKDFSDISKKDFFVGLFILILGSPVGLPLFDAMEILGKEKSLKRFAATT